MESSNLSVRVDVNDKKSFEQFCANVGMNVSTAINMFIKAVLREQKLPFEICSKTFDDTVYEKLQEAESEMNHTCKRYTKEEILESMILNMVEHKEEVTITQKEEGKNTILEVKVAESDMGRVIGKQGKVAKAIRTVMKSLSAKEHKKVVIEFVD